VLAEPGDRVCQPANHAPRFRGRGAPRLAPAARAALKVFGVVLERNSGISFEERVNEVARDHGGVLELSLRALLATLKTVREQADKLDRMAISQARQNPICRHLMAIPGVGALTSVAYATAIEDPAKFRKSRSVGSFLGLTPKDYQSGETDVSGRISKWGDPLVRAYLYEAANSLLIHCKKWSALKAWGMRIAKRAGMNKARVAVARKLAVIMHQMWATGEEFRWSNKGRKMRPEQHEPADEIGH
jgi:transposase